MTAPDSAEHRRRGLLRTNAGIIYLAVIVAIPLVLASPLVGLNIVFAVGLLVVFAGVALAVDRIRARRNPSRNAQTHGTVSATGVAAALLVFALIQAVPYARSHSNGPIVAEPKWADGQTRSLTRFGLHKQAKLSKADVALLVAGLEKMPEFKQHARTS